MVSHTAAATSCFLDTIKSDGLGLEIAPYFDPFLDKEKFNVKYTDYISNEEIQAVAGKNPGAINRAIPQIDFVWRPGTKLSDCHNSVEKFDYVVASHVMEHVPNPFGWLNELLSVTKMGGHVAVFLPSRIHTNDYFRNDTPFSQLFEWWMEQPATPTIAQVVDFMSESLEMADSPSEQVSRDEHLKNMNVYLNKRIRYYTPEQVIETATHIYNHRSYLDIHCTVWTKESFLENIDNASNYGILAVETMATHDDDGEFLAILKKTGEPRLLPPEKKTIHPKAADSSNSQNDEMLKHIYHVTEIISHEVKFLIENLVKEKVILPVEKPKSKLLKW